jgi:hypothetical protein
VTVFCGILILKGKKNIVTTSTSTQCLKCGASEQETPLVRWKYRGRAVWICADCLPLMIHKRHLLLDKLEAETPAEAQHTQPEAG